MPVSARLTIGLIGLPPSFTRGHRVDGDVFFIIPRRALGCHVHGVVWNQVGGCSGGDARLECPCHECAAGLSGFRRNASGSTPRWMPSAMPEPAPGRDAAVLVSGGVDSAVLCIDLLRRFAQIWPIYV